MVLFLILSLHRRPLIKERHLSFIVGDRALSNTRYRLLRLLGLDFFLLLNMHTGI